MCEGRRADTSDKTSADEFTTKQITHGMAGLATIINQFIPMEKFEILFLIINFLLGELKT